MRIKELFEAPAKKANKKEITKDSPVGVFSPNPDIAKVDTNTDEKSFPVLSLNKNQSTANTTVKKSGGKKLGSGVFATTYSVPKDITSAVKISTLHREAWQADGYYNYIKTVFNKQDNPYLPQIYEVLRVQPPNGSPYLMVNIEQLIHGSELSAEEAILVAEKIFGDPNIEKKIMTYQRRYEYTYGSNKKPIKLTQGMIFFFISRQLEQYARYKTSTPDIVDPQLKEALTIVYNLKKKGYTVDLHDENFMFRRTPYGPQLVLTDPLAFYNGRVKINTGKPPTKKAPRPKAAKEVDVGDTLDFLIRKLLKR